MGHSAEEKNLNIHLSQVKFQKALLQVIYKQFIYQTIRYWTIVFPFHYIEPSRVHISSSIRETRERGNTPCKYLGPARGCLCQVYIYMYSASETSVVCSILDRFTSITTENFVLYILNLPTTLGLRASLFRIEQYTYTKLSELEKMFLQKKNLEEDLKTSVKHNIFITTKLDFFYSA